MDSTVTIPGHVRDYLGQWIREYDAAVARPVPVDPESHEQLLMESSRLLGTAGALLRLIDGAAIAAEPYDPTAPALAAAAALARNLQPSYPYDPPAGPPPRGLASCGHPANADGECNCSSWPERAPDAGQAQFDAFADQGYRP